MTIPSNEPRHELHRPIALRELNEGERSWEVETDTDERAAIAARFGLVDLPALAGRFTLSLVEDRGEPTVHLDGRITARVVQTCVVTLEPFESTIEADFDGLCTEPEQDEAPAVMALPAEEEEDVVGDIIDGRIDLGEVLVQQLALELDPFPRRPGVEFAGHIEDDGSDDVRPDADNPFAVLGKLKDNRD